MTHPLVSGTARLSWLLMLMLVTLTARAGETLRCDSRLVTAGDWQHTLSERCGTPYFVEEWTELHSVRSGPESAVSRSIRFEDWFYDFGPERLLVRARLRDGQLEGFETLSRRGRSRPHADCRDAALPPGLSTGELVSLCGLPSQRDALPEAVVHGESPVQTILPTRRERWLYRATGSTGRLVWIERGRITRAEPLTR